MGEDLSAVTEYSIKNLLEVGAHFGHQAIHWNPKMSRYVFMKRKGIHIIDLQKTVLYLEKACNQIKNITAQGGKVLFVGTKKQIKELVKEKVGDSGHFYMTQRWIGGLLTNHKVVKKSIERLRKYTEILNDPTKQTDYTKNQLVKIKKERDKLHNMYAGVVDLEKPPEAMFIIDVFCEKNAALEAKTLGIPVFSIVDTNGDPDLVDVIIPGNDDAIRSVGLFLDYVMAAIKEGTEIYKRNRQEEDLFTEQVKREESLKKDDETEVKSETAPSNEDATADKPVAKKVGLANEANEADKPRKPMQQESPASAKDAEEAKEATEGDGVKISANLVKELRDITDVSMMECKKALIQTGGDKDAAIKILRERGMAVAQKRAGKDANEGSVVVLAKDNTGMIANLCCETDFVAKSEHFTALVDELVTNFTAQGKSYLESEALKTFITETTSKTGEKIELSDIQVYENDQARFFSYLHANNKVGVVLGLTSDKPEALAQEQVTELGKDLCLQVAAMNPIAISMDKIPATAIEEQKQVFLKQMEDDKKPADIKEKILEGKINKYFGEMCLLDMEFVKENGKAVKDLLAEVSKEVGANLTISEFKRNQIGG